MVVRINEKKINMVACTSFWKRFRGMMFQRKKENGYYFPNCNGVHTFFMIQPIDLVLTDSNDTILYVYPNVKPWRLILPKKNVHHTYEFPVGILPDIKRKDTIKKEY